MILAHYYVDGEVQEIADYVGDSYFLAKKASEIPAGVIIFCGVSFMGESAKILNPEKKFYSVGHRQFCPNMKRISLESVLHALETLDPEVKLDEEMRQRAKLPLQRMLELAQ